MEFRAATEADIDLLFRWRNDPETRQNSINTAEITFEEHLKWCQKSFANPNRQVFIAIVNNIPLGMVRLDYDGNDCTLSWTVAPEARGRGLGKEMVKAAVQLPKVKAIKAQIRKENQKSIKIAESAGFKQAGLKDGILFFEIVCSPES